MDLRFVLSIFIVFTFFNFFAFAQADQEKELLDAGIKYAQLEKYDDAIFYFDKVLEINQNNTKALNVCQ